MTRIDGRKLGIWSLRLDAAYCLILGILVASTAPYIANVVALPLPLLFITGMIVALWAGLVLVMVARMRLRLALALVMGVNIVAAILIAAASLTAATTLVTIAVLAIALDVGAFAASQMLAIRRLHTAPRSIAAAG